MALLQFDEDERQAIDEADQIASPLVDASRDPKLRGQEEVVVLRLVPVDHPQRFVGLVAFIVLEADPHAVLEQLVDFPVCLGQAHGTAVFGQFLDGQTGSLLRRCRG